ncbi:MAG: TonB-dependent receptor plug domain-containing protein, partial [Pseudomonadota bacterium]
MVHKRVLIAALISGCSLSAISTPAFSQNAAQESAQSQEQTFSIPAQSLDAALSAFAEASGSDLLYPSELVDGKRSSAVDGAFTASNALRQLLQGTGLVATQVSRNVYSLRDQASPGSSDASTTSVRGIIRSEVTGNGLPGAQVEIVGTQQRATTDERGYFTIPEVSVTASQLRVSYLGDPEAVFDLPAGAFERSRLNLVFGQQAASDDILVVGYLSSIQKSLNQQLRAANNSTIVSADQLGGFPAETISEALRRVPGVGFGRDAETGEGSRITVRGFSSEAINIQLNGIEQQGTSFGRTVDLSGFLTENLATVTIHKSLLPSHEASGSGGLVEIETKSALDYDDFDLNLNVEGELSPARDYGEEYQLNGILATKLTDNLAVVGTVQYRDTNRTNVDSNLIDVVPPVLPEGFLFLSRVPFSFEFPFDPELPQRLIGSTAFVQRDRDETALNASLGLAWDVADHTRLRLDMQRNVRDVTGVTTNNNFVATTPIVNMPIAELGGEVRRRETLSNLRPNIAVNTLDNKLTSDTISFRGDTDFGRWEFEYR